MEDEVNLRENEEEDDPLLAAIIRHSLEEFNANKPGTVYFDKSTDHLSTIFKTERSKYLVLEINNKIAGGGGIYPTQGLPPDTCELVKMYLSPQYRGKGYGKMILERCVQVARKYGYQKMYLETLHELTSAIPLYQKMGFTFLEKPMGKSGHSGCDFWMIRKL